MPARPTTTRSGTASATIPTQRPPRSAPIASRGWRPTALARRSGPTIRDTTRSPGTPPARSTAAGTDGAEPTQGAARRRDRVGCAARAAVVSGPRGARSASANRCDRAAAGSGNLDPDAAARRTPLAAGVGRRRSSGVRSGPRREGRSVRRRGEPDHGPCAHDERPFGDGEAGVTPGPIAVHDYSALPQKTAFNDLLVKVTALDGSGQMVEGRLPLHIRNVAFATRLRGMATIFAVPVPRFPEAGPDGIVRQKFRLWHAEDGPVQIAGATLSRFFLPAKEGSAPAAPTTVALDHSRVLRHAEIPPGAFVEESLEYDFGANAAVYAVTFAVQGLTASGLQARGELALLRPSPRPTRENSVPIQHPAMIQKIRRAMAILNQETVSQEDIWRLEREGKLQSFCGVVARR